MGKKRFKETNYFRDVRRWKARRGKRVNSENQKGDPRNYIRFGRGDIVEWKEEYGQRFLRDSRESRDRQLQAARKKSTQGETKFR